MIPRSTGRVELLGDRAKLRQDTQQFLTQRRNRDGFGASLDDLVGIPTDPFTLRAQLSSRIRGSVRAFQSLQDRFHFGVRTPAERLFSITNLRVGQATQDGQTSRTSFAFRLDVVSVAGQTTPVGGTLVTAG